MTPIVEFNLSNEEYHHGEKYAEYISSTQLKAYANSPAYAHHKMLNPEPITSQSVLQGTRFHNIMESIIRGKSMEEAIDGQYASFTPPIDENGKKLRANSNAYKDTYNTFMEGNQGKEIITEDEMTALKGMAVSATNNPLVKKIIKWAKPDEEKCAGPEVSVFVEIDGVKVKVRYDVLTCKNQIVDWKTTSLSDLTTDSITKAILSFKYEVSASLYQKAFAELTGGTYPTFYWVFVQTSAPYDCVVVDASFMAYSVENGEVVNDMNGGVIEMNKLLAIHKECLEKQEWLGAETFIKPDEHGIKIIQPTYPTWAYNNLTNKYGE